MSKDCSNCIYKDREWGDNPCRTCDDECDNWVGVDDEEADKKYETEVITRGNCMMCGKELTEGLFFCKECEEKTNSRK